MSVFCTDKTGTLTRGRPEVTDVVALEGDEASVLALAAGLAADQEVELVFYPEPEGLLAQLGKRRRREGFLPV
jgi:magnesium-transporting ATPase (P-type)